MGYPTAAGAPTFSATLSADSARLLSFSPSASVTLYPALKHSLFYHSITGDSTWTELKLSGSNRISVSFLYSESIIIIIILKMNR